MSKKILLLSLLLLGFVIWSLAGTTGKIAGRVTDSETGEPLAGVNVYIENIALGGVTDSYGDYYILNVRPGSYTVIASMVGYKEVIQENVDVSVDRTIKVDFKLQSTVFEGEKITVVAQRDAVRPDVSASMQNIEAEQMEETPMVVDIEGFYTLQAGIQKVVDEDGNEQILIRGGGLDQQGLVVDGLNLTNNEANSPMDIINLSAVEEVSVIKGGFNAEYGNIRSGLINVVTKEGETHKYIGSLDVRYGVAHQKHRGESIFSRKNYFMRPYLDPEVAFVGTKNGPWNEYTKRQYRTFEGWNTFVANNPELGLTPQEAYDLFTWQHRAEGSEALGHPHPGKYGDVPDINADMSFGGPVPFLNDKLTFFASFRDYRESYLLPAALDYLHGQNSLIKFNSRLKDNMKIGLEFAYGHEKNAGVPPSNSGGDRGMYFVHGSSPMDIYSSMLGFTFDHVISPSTFYNIRISRVHQKNNANGPEELRDKTILRTFGNVSVDEQPWGYDPVQGYQYALSDRMVLGGVGGGFRDLTEITTYNVKLDFVSQLNKYNEVKAGFELVADNYDVYRGEQGLDPTGNFIIEWKQTPLRYGIYLQDKIEFEGMIANLGVRVDINDPNTDWYTVDPYSRYFSRAFKSQLTTSAPTEPASGNVHVAPRLGISHPITENSKLYFNYGHFYSMPPSGDMYEINSGVQGEGIARIGNPSLKLPRTIAYELGYAHELADMFLISIAGYYKDVTDQIGDVQFVSYDESVSYSMARNDNYEDIRGIEISLEKRWGAWITGWLNYNYQVKTSGLVGREFQFQDPNRQLTESKRNPYQEKPLPQPFARGSIQIRTPDGWGPKLGDLPLFDKFSVNLLGYYEAGDYLTWDPIPPYTENNNVQWDDSWMFDLRIMKNISLGRYQFDLFVDIENVFDLKYLTGGGFISEETDDFRDYMNSLHLDIYNQAKYQSDSRFTPGNDRPGDAWSKDKPYINMPNGDFAAWSKPRSIVLGLRLSF